MRLSLNLGKGRRHYIATYSWLFCLFAVMFFCAIILAGKSLISVSDGINQQYAFFVYEGQAIREIAYHLLHAGELRIPLWDTSLGYGADIPTSIMQFCGDPLYLLSVVFPRRYAEVGFNLVVVLRLFLAGLAFSWYASSRETSPFGNLVGSLLYAFSGWMLLAASQTVLTTPAIYLPLLLLGTDRVMNNESPLLLVGATAMLFVTYFYFGYMACLLVPLYAVGQVLFVDDGKKLRDRGKAYWRSSALRVGRAVLFFVLGIGLAGFVLLPMIHVLLGMGRLSLSYFSPALYSLSTYAKMVEGVVGLYNNGSDSVIGCAGLVVPCAVLMYGREGNVFLKVALATLTVFLLLPIVGRVFNGMGYVTFRWAYAYACCLSMVAARMVEDLDSSTLGEQRHTFGVVLALMVVALVFPNARTAVTFASLLVLMAIVCCMVFAPHLSVSARQRWFKPTILVLVALTTCVPASFRFSSLAPKLVDNGTAWERMSNTPEGLVQSQLDHGSLVRYSWIDTNHVYNSDAVCNRNGYDFYASVYNGVVGQFENEMFLASTSIPHRVSGPCTSSYLNAAFGTRYYVADLGSKRRLPYGFSKTPISTMEADDKEYGLFASQNVLPFAYTFASSMSAETFASLTPIQKWQALLQVVSVEGAQGEGQDGLSFSDAESDLTLESCSEGVEWSEGRVVVSKKGAMVTLAFKGVPKSELYLQIENMSIEGIPPALEPCKGIAGLYKYLNSTYSWAEPKSYSITAESGKGHKATFRGSTPYSHMYGGRDSVLLCLDYSDEARNKVTITFHNVGVYTFDSLRMVMQPVEGLQDLVAERRADPVEVTEGVNAYSASATLCEGGYLYFSVPWSEGWTATVDGREVPVRKANVAFMAVDVPAGEHRVELRYVTPCLREGACVSLASLLALVAIMSCGKMRKALGLIRSPQ